MGDQAKWTLARKGCLDEIEWYLAKKGYLDPSDEQFGENRLTRKLGMLIHSDSDKKVQQASAWVSFVACPEKLADDAIPVTSDEFWASLAPGSRTYPPREQDPFIPYPDRRMTLEGVLCPHEVQLHQQEKWGTRFLLVERNGFTEMGWSLAFKFRDKLTFPFVTMMTRFWQFAGFVLDLYQQHGLERPFTLSLNMKNTAGSVLSNLGKGWKEPFDESLGMRYAPECLELNVQIIRHLKSPVLDPSEVEHLVHDFATLVDNAYGERQPRCYNNLSKDPNQQLPVDNLRVWDV